MSRSNSRGGVGLMRLLSVASVGSSRSVASSYQSSCDDSSNSDESPSPPSPTTTLQPSIVHAAHQHKPRKLKSILRKPQEETSAFETESGAEENGSNIESTTTAAPPSPRRRRRQQRHRRANGTRRRRSMHHHVGFGSVEVREYARIVGDNPSVSSGPPISYVPLLKTSRRDRWRF
jgi:hypothetical protein